MVGSIFISIFSTQWLTVNSEPTIVFTYDTNSIWMINAIAIKMLYTNSHVFWNTLLISFQVYIYVWLLWLCFKFCLSINFTRFWKSIRWKLLSSNTKTLILCYLFIWSITIYQVIFIAAHFKASFTYILINSHTFKILLATSNSTTSKLTYRSSSCSGCLIFRVKININTRTWKCLFPETQVSVNKLIFWFKNIFDPIWRIDHELLLYIFLIVLSRTPISLGQILLRNSMRKWQLNSMLICWF